MECRTFVVEGENVLQAHQVGHDALQHLAFGFERFEFLAAAASQQVAADAGDVHALAQFEGVEVGDDDFGPVHFVEHVGRHELAICVIAVWIVGLEDSQAIFDGQAGRDNQEATGEVFAVGAADGVDRLPGDEHGHDGGFAGTGGELERETQEFGVGVVVGGGQMFEQSLAGRGARGDLCEPDGGLDRFHLTEERADASKRVAAPMLEQAGGFGRDLPLARVWPGAPLGDVAAHFVDDRVGVVLLLLGRQPGTFIENDILLGRRGFSFLRLGDRRDELGAATGVDDFLRRLAVGIEFPMPLGALVRRIEDRMLEERIGHELS
jgi:hypothetical protein